MSVNRSKTRQKRSWDKWRESGAVGTLTFDMNQHPEIKPGEVFLGNFSDMEDFDRIGHRTKRPGIVALDALGRPISQRAWSRAFPVFVELGELIGQGIVPENHVQSIRYFSPM